MIVHKERRRMWKEVIVAYSSRIFQCVCADERCETMNYLSEQPEIIGDEEY
jgi:hypothetical protein